MNEHELPVRRLLTVTFRLDGEEMNYDIDLSPEHMDRGYEFITLYFKPMIAHFFDWAQRGTPEPRTP